MLSRTGVLLMRAFAHLPLSWVRAMGWMLGRLLFALAGSRRRIVSINLELCFPQIGAAQRRALALEVFVNFARAWLDRGWLWHGAAQVLRRRLRIVGETHELDGNTPIVLFAPHFVGLDAGWTALTGQVSRAFVTIYTHQANAIVDDWILRGRERFGQPRLFDRAAGVKPLVLALREGAALYLLPDMNYGLPESVFLPFFGVQAATVTSMSRLARLGRATVVPVVTRMTPDGYEVRVMKSWEQYPSTDVEADTLRMNRALEQYVQAMPGQYYWVHKRFKDRPEGQAPVY